MLLSSGECVSNEKARYGRENNVAGFFVSGN